MWIPGGIYESMNVLRVDGIGRINLGNGLTKEVFENKFEVSQLLKLIRMENWIGIGMGFGPKRESPFTPWSGLGAKSKLINITTSKVKAK